MANGTTFHFTELVEQDGTLHLATILCDAYRNELQARGLLETAAEGSLEKAIHGGQSPEETLKHFTFRFPTSSARIVCVLVDPSGDFGALPANVFQSFSNDRISVLDAPCGAGAGLLALLTTLAVAREKKRVPRLPLTVSVVGADISQTALDIYTGLAARITPLLANEGIYLELSTELWDATQADQTSRLCDRWLDRHFDANEYFVLVGNLSGVGDELAESFKRSFHHITERIANIRSTILWVEPIIKLKLLQVIAGIFSFAPWLKRPTNLSSAASSRFRWWQSVEQKHLNGSVTVDRFARVVNPPA
jgi:hypothetical protein